MRTIDADALRECYTNLDDNLKVPITICKANIDSMPTITAEPKHGRWIKNEDRSGWHCSCCGKDDLYAYPYTKNNERELQDFYCPNCGAKMDEAEKDDRA